MASLRIFTLIRLGPNQNRDFLRFDRIIGTRIKALPVRGADPIHNRREHKMDYSKIKMIGGADSLLDGLWTESRRRRKTLKRLAQPGAAARPPRNDLSPKLEFGVRSLATLSVPKRNVRALDSAHVREIASSINDFGFTVPVLIDQHANIIAGVVRAEAARMVGLTQVPCIIASHLTKSELRMLRIRLNRTQENGQWSIRRPEA